MCTNRNVHYVPDRKWVQAMPNETMYDMQNEIYMQGHKAEGRKEKMKVFGRFGKGATLRKLEEMGRTIELERRVLELERQLDLLYDYMVKSIEAEGETHDNQNQFNTEY